MLLGSANVMVCMGVGTLGTGAGGIGSRVKPGGTVGVMDVCDSMFLVMVEKSLASCWSALCWLLLSGPGEVAEDGD